MDKISALLTTAFAYLEKLSCVTDLILRCIVFKFFFFSGLQKVDNWQTTLFFFRNEYHVPLISPQLAAYLGTAAELTLPVLLLLGLCGRLSAMALFVFNIVAVASYSFLWTDAGHVGLMQHLYYGLFLLVTITHGPGILSLDKLIEWPGKRN